MAETIKGINVVIGAETTGLSKALSDVDKKSKDLQSELKQVDKLLKLDPTNTELLTQKQKLLGDSVTNTKERLDSLREAQAQVDEQFASGQINEGQYRAFQREIAKTEQDLKNFEKRSDSTKRSLAELGDSLQRTGDKMSGVGKTLSTAVTAPLAAGGALLFKGAVDAEQAQGKLQASLGLTADEADKLGESAKQVWKDGFGESIDEANNAILSVKKNMSGVAEDELAQVTEGAMTIAQTFDQDVNEVTAAAGVTMKNFGISGQEALDIITVGFQEGGDYSGELLDTLREYSPQFANLGLSADQSMAMLIAGAEAGAWNLDKVGDSIKEFYIRAQDGSKTTAEGFAMIGMDAEQMGADIAAGGEEAQQAYIATITALAAMEDPLKQNQAGVALFGTQWEDVRADVITAMADGASGLDGFQGATQRATDAVQDSNPGLALKQALREVQDAIGPALMPIADIISDSVAPALKSLADWFTNLTPEGQKTALAITGIALALGPVLFVLGGMIGAVGKIIAAFSAVSGAIAAAGGLIALITGPIGIAIAAVAALAAAAYLIIKNWDAIKAFFAGLWDWLKSFFSEWGTVILAVLAPFIGIPLLIYQNWDQIKGALSELWASITEAIVSFGQGILSFFQSIGQLFTGLWESIKASTIAIWNSIKDFFVGLWEAITQVFAVPLGAIQALITFVWDAIMLVTAVVWWGIYELLSAVWNGIVAIITPIVEGLKNFFSASWNLVKDVTITVWNAIKEFFSAWWEALKTTTIGAITTVITPIIDGWNSLKESTVSAWNSITDFFSEWWLALKNLVSNWVNAYIVDPIVGAWELLKTKTAEIWQGIKDVITGIFDSLISGIKMAINALIGLANGAINALNKINIDIPDYVPGFGGKSFGFDIPNIPYLASGGIAWGPTLAMIGEGGQPEVVSPLNDLFAMIQKAVEETDTQPRSGASGGITQHITVQSPTPLSPSETARQVKNASRLLALEW